MYIPEKPVFRPHFEVSVCPGDGVLVQSEARAIVFSGALYEAVVTAILRGLCTDEIAESLASHFSKAHIFFALGSLWTKGYLGEVSAYSADAGSQFSHNELAYWSSCAVSPRRLSSRKKRVAVTIIDRSCTHITSLVRSCFEENGIRVGGSAHFSVVVVQDYLDPGLSSIVKARLRDHSATMLFRPVGKSALIGPIFEPSSSTCVDCLVSALSANRPLHKYINDNSDGIYRSSTSASATRATIGVATNVAACEVLRYFVTDQQRRLFNRILEINTAKWRHSFHEVFPDSHCPTCAPPNKDIPFPGTAPQIGNAAIVHTFDGGFRRDSSHETLKLLSPLVSPLTGIVPFVKVERHMPDGLHVCVSRHRFRRNALSFQAVAEESQMNCAGKGLTAQQARVSALSEAIERYSGIFQGAEPRLESRFDALPPDLRIHPNDCMLFSDDQYATRDNSNAARTLFCFVPQQFRRDRSMHWSPVWKLSSSGYRLLPTALLYYDCESHCGVNPYCISCSNGCASGTTVEEACLQGLLEIVERDAVAIWWFNRVSRPEIDVSTFPVGPVHNMIAQYATAGRRVWALDLTNDLSIPVVAAISCERDSLDKVIFGFGAHLDPQIALSRAFTEMNQSFADITATTGGRRPVPHDFSTKEALRWWKDATVADESYLAPAGVHTFSDLVKTFPCETFSQVLQFCNERLSAAGLSAYWVDQTRAETRLATVRVIVPGARHFWPRFAPGRLFDVPVSLGWQKRILREAEMNPWRIFT